MRDRFEQILTKFKRARASRRKSGRRMAYILTLMLVVLLGSFAWSIQYLYFGNDPDGTEITLAQLNVLMGEQRVASSVLHEEDQIMTGTYVEPAPEPKPEPKPKDKNPKGNSGSSKSDGKNAGKDKPKTPPAPEPNIPAITAPPGAGDFWTSYPAEGTPVLLGALTSAGAEVSVDGQTKEQAVRAVSTFLLPLMILANLFALLFSAGRGGGGGIGDVQMFGTIKKGQASKSQTHVTFNEVAGAQEAVAELREVKDYLQNPAKYRELGATPPKGVLLVGPPGCGKTLLARAVAGEAGVPFFSVAGAEFVESLVGVGAARVRDLFARVRAVAPAIVFIDELDAAGRKRAGGGGGGGSDEREQTLNQMLVEMDGFDVSKGLVVIGATNRPDILDPALLRPGRFDRHVTVDQPDAEGRQAILELHAKRKPMDAEVDFAYLAKRTPGFSGADLANVINESALLTIRQGKQSIKMAELEEAVQRVLAGPQKRSRILSDDERNRAAYHESGHAVVAAAAAGHEEIHRVSILARGKGIGLTNVRKETDSLLLTRSELFTDLVTAMGGLASEEMVFGEHSTGAEQDLERATDIARDMVGRFGMGTRRRRLLVRGVDDYLNNETPLAELSPQTHQEMEAEVDALIADAEKEAGRLLVEHRKTLDNLAARLAEEETIEGVSLDAILEDIRPNGKVPHDQAVLSSDRAATEVITPNRKPAAEATGGGTKPPTTDK
ncbi:MAG: cell division protease FtsH [Actinomycetota bacterium]|nr:cell division protease FtsH [Actinomycetota bacterium]